MPVITADFESALTEEFFGCGAKGYFVEVGAHAPRIGSQTWRFEQAGWTGVLVEPQPGLAEVLRRERKARVFAVACSSPENAGRMLPLYLAGWMSALDVDRMAPGVEPQGVIEVKAMTLDQILDETGAPEQIDFLSIDVEGHEIEVLRGFDFARWRPRMVLIEDHVGNLDKLRYMQRSGYRLVRHSQFNGWYVPNGSAVNFGWDDRWRIVRKYHLALPFRMLRDESRRLRRRRAAQMQAQVWAVIQNSTSQAVLENFIRQFGSTEYGSMARARLDEVKRGEASVVAPPIVPVSPHSTAPITLSGSSGLSPVTVLHAE